jgi:hypothetical protein
MGIQREINSIQYKIVPRDMKDDMVMIPFNYCFGNDTCLQDFITNWI